MVVSVFFIFLQGDAKKEESSPVAYESGSDSISKVPHDHTMKLNLNSLSRLHVVYCNFTSYQSSSMLISVFQLNVMLSHLHDVSWKVKDLTLLLIF